MLRSSSRRHIRPGQGRALAQTPEYSLKWEAILLLAVILGCILWSTHAAWDMSARQLAISLGFGLLLGVVASKQRARMRLVSHVVAAVLALLAAWWQVTVAFMHHQPFDLAQSIGSWSGLFLNDNAAANLALFYVLMLVLATGLAYGSVWCVRWPRWLWPMHVLHTLLLLYLLYPEWDENIPVFLIFMLSSLLLSVHVHLDVSFEDWMRSGIAYPAHLKKVMMRLGALTAIAVLLLAWFLPAGYINPGAANLLGRAQANLKQFLSSQLKPLSLTAYPFSDTLSLGNTPELSSQVVATVQSSAQKVYLAARWYDTYSGEGWTNGDTTAQSYHAQETLPSQTLMRYPLQQTITMMTPAEQGYLLGAPGISAMSLPATILTNTWDGEPVAWFAQQEALAAGTRYTVISSVSDADELSLRAVVQPTKAAPTSSGYNQVFPFLQLPATLDARIASLAARITTGVPDMYDKAVALETYLRTHYTYNLHIQLPAGQEAVSWFLFNSGHQGFCTFFASAMAILARSIGIPARVVTGYAPGSYDTRAGRQVIQGTDAHSWTQIYFANYGWINFEPTASFPAFNHPLPTLASPQTPVRQHIPATSVSGFPAALNSALPAFIGVLTVFLLLLCLLCLLTLQRLRPRAHAAELYRSVCLLARWAGCGSRPSQTPCEFIQRLSLSLPRAKEPLERLCDLYVREQWAHPASAEHPRLTGELQELVALWLQLRPHLVKAFLHRRAYRLRFKRG